MDAEVLAVDQEPAPIRHATQKPVLHGIGENIVFVTHLFVEGDQIMSELLRHAWPKILLRESLGFVGSIRDPHVNRKVGEPRIDVDRDIRPQQMILSLRYLAACVIDFDGSLAFERRLTHLPQLTREPAMRGKDVVFLLDIDRGTETGMRHGTVVTLEIVLKHCLPIRLGGPGIPTVQLKAFQMDAASGDNVEQIAKVRGKRHCLGVKIDKDEWAQGLHSKRQEWIVFQPEVGLGSRARRALQATGEIVSPGVISALHHLRVSAALHHFMPAMAAYIDKARQPCFVTDHDNGYFARIAGDVVSRIRQLVCWTYVVPALPENLFDFTCCDGLVCVPVGRKRFAAIKRCEQTSCSLGSLTWNDLDHRIYLLDLLFSIIRFAVRTGPLRGYPSDAAASIVRG